nr:hypothetical protein GCM10017745_55210 [Saccharothrix mutabilis subsp. capreolus]
MADGTSTEEGGDSTMTRPASAESLEGYKRRAHDLATAHGKPQVARVLLHLFGGATCPACDTEFVVAERVGG